MARFEEGIGFDGGKAKWRLLGFNGGKAKGRLLETENIKVGRRLDGTVTRM